MIILSIVIVAFNNQKDLEECIDSIFTYNELGEQIEVIVVDNSDKEKGIQQFIQENYTKVVYKKNINNGFGAANNIGAKISKGEYLLFLNADTLLYRGIFHLAISKFKINSNLALFGGQLLGVDNKNTYSFGFIDKHGFIWSLLLKLCQKHQVFISEMMFVSGANLFVRRSVFDMVGGFDTKIFLYNEESDLIRRILKKGFQIAFFKDIMLVHKEGGSIGSDSIKSLEYRLESYAYYCFKYNLNFIKYSRAISLDYKVKNFLWLILKFRTRYDRNFMMNLDRILSLQRERYLKLGKGAND